MQIKQNDASRRNFIKKMGVIAAIPMIPGSMNAMEQLAYQKDKNTHRIISANIRVALPDDEAAGNGWSTRKDMCARIIRKKDPDIICCQEVLKVQDKDMKDYFSGFGVFGFEGPEMDMFPEGYHGIAKNIIMYSKKRYEFVSSGCYWLSETPLIAGSKSWDTARARHCNWMRLKDKNTNREFRVINTHLDHVAQVARENQVRMIMDESKQYLEDFPQLFTGDFNSDAKNEVIKSIQANGWTDTYAAIHGDADPGPTVHGFKGENHKPGRNGRIDFIFSKGPVKPMASEIIKDNENGQYPSDHYFIYADVSL